MYLVYLNTQARATTGAKFESFPAVWPHACLRGREKAGLCSTAAAGRQAGCGREAGRHGRLHGTTSRRRAEGQRDQRSPRHP